MTADRYIEAQLWFSPVLTAKTRACNQLRSFFKPLITFSIACNMNIKKKRNIIIPENRTALFDIAYFHTSTQT